MKCNNQTKHIGMILKCLNKRVVRHLNKEFEQFDLTLVQHEVLAYLFYTQDEHDVYQKELEEYLESTNPTVTGIVKRLEVKGLINRTACSHDARCKKLTLTEQGISLLEQTAKLGPEIVENKLTKYLEKQDVEQLVDLLEKAIKGLDE